LAASVGVGRTAAIQVLAHYNTDDVVDVTSTATLSADDSSLGSIADAKLTGLLPGTVKVTAQFDGVSGDASVSVVAPTSVVVAPETISLQSGASMTITLTGEYDDGATVDLAAYATITSADPDLVAVSVVDGAVTLEAGIDAVGMATLEGVTSLSIRIGASSAELATAQVEVTPAITLTQVRIVPPAFTVAPFGAYAFTVTAKYSNDTELDVGALSIWSASSGCAVLSADPAGEATAGEPGACSITAQYGGKSDSFPVVSENGELVGGANASCGAALLMGCATDLSCQENICKP